MNYYYHYYYIVIATYSKYERELIYNKFPIYMYIQPTCERCARAPFPFPFSSCHVSSRPKVLYKAQPNLFDFGPLASH